MTAVLLILLAGLFDRIRGSGWFSYSHAIGMAAMGSVISYLLGIDGWLGLAFVMLFCIGASPGWGNPLGAAFDNRKMGTDYESWQTGMLRSSVLLALVARGLIWTAPALLLAPFHIGVLIFVPLAAMTFPAAVYISRELPGNKSEAWALMEFLRGLLMGLAAYIGGMYG